MKITICTHKVKLKKAIFACILLVSFTHIVWAAYPAKVRDISGREYFQAVKEAIDNAGQSISAALYAVSLREDQPNSQVYQLCQSLVDAKNRDVDIRVCEFPAQG